MRPVATRLVCDGCGFEPGADVPYPFRCANASRRDDLDHVLRRRIELAGAKARPDLAALFVSPPAHPFRAYRRLLHSHSVACAGGLSDGDYVEIVSRLNASVGRVTGGRFRATPFAPSGVLAGALNVGALWIKDETRNVAGSHKARHLMGLALWLEVVEALGRDGTVSPSGQPSLAIASCGNAALAAATLARAAGRELETYVPERAEPAMLRRLEEQGARVTRCRRASRGDGDPSYRRFRQAVADGALPFTCQGPDNGLTIEGGQTLAWEMASVLAREGASLDRLFVQVGGGALATACIDGLREARDLGVIESLPRLHAVQTGGAAPLARAWERLVARILRRAGAPEAVGGGSPAERARYVGSEVPREEVERDLRYAATHRSQFMWPWEEEPQSIATAILDDETYDWLPVVRGLLETGGWPIVASEETLRAAHRLAREATGIPADPTGTAGLAGVLELQAGADRVGTEETVGLLFTGVER